MNPGIRFKLGSAFADEGLSCSILIGAKLDTVYQHILPLIALVVLSFLFAPQCYVVPCLDACWLCCQGG